MQSARDPSPESLTALLGDRRGALDATAPAVAFGLGWILAGRSLAWGAGAALVTGTVLAAVRWRRGGRPLAALLGLLGVSVAVLVMLHTGRAADFFLTSCRSQPLRVVKRTPTVWATGSHRMGSSPLRDRSVAWGDRRGEMWISH